MIKKMSVMMKRFFSIATLVIIVMAIVGPAMAKNDKGTVAAGTVSLQDKRKANYIYMQAHALKESDSIAAYFDLIKYAHQLDTTNTAAAYYYGYLLLLKDNSSKEDMERGIALMKKHVDAHPEDYYEASYYSDACMTLRRYDLALEVMEKLAEINPTKTEVQMRLAAAYVRNESPYRQMTDVVAAWMSPPVR